MSSPNQRRPIIIRRKKVVHRHHGGSWKIALADFMTALMALFLVMWILSSASRETREGVADYFSMPLLAAMTNGDSVAMSPQVIPGGGPDVTSQQGERMRIDLKRQTRPSEQQRRAFRDNRVGAPSHYEPWETVTNTCVRTGEDVERLVCPTPWTGDYELTREFTQADGAEKAYYRDTITDDDCYQVLSEVLEFQCGAGFAGADTRTREHRDNRVGIDSHHAEWTSIDNACFASGVEARETACPAPWLGMVGEG